MRAHKELRPAHALRVQELRLKNPRFLIISSAGKLQFSRPLSYFGARMRRVPKAEDGCELQSESQCECRRPPLHAPVLYEKGLP